MKKLLGKSLVILEGLLVLCLALAGIGLIISGGRLSPKPVQPATDTPVLLTSIPTLTDVPTNIPVTEPAPTLTPTQAVALVITPSPPRIPGVTPADLQVKLQSRNLACSPANNNTLDGQGFYSWSCSRNDYDIQYFVTITSQNPGSVDAIHAAVVQTSLPTGKQQAAFLGYVAMLSFPKQPDLAAQARLWVEKTLPAMTGKPGDIHTIILNGIDFQLFGPASARTLFIGNLK